ncbi:MAG: four helix bundle protein [Deltaproteobacteria bacterium]|nr:four helix bundle protein [Deltaproteobacteria bacterium]
MLRDCTGLKVWQESYQLCLEIYKVTKIFHKNRNLAFSPK